MFCVILISIWIQLNILNNIPLFGVKANIGIVLVVSLSILCGQAVGISVGITYGILSDVLFGKAFGINTLLLFLTGFFCGKMSKGFSKENKTALIMVTIAATVVIEVLTYLILVVVYHYEMALMTIVKTLVLEGIYHVFLTRIFFKGLSSLSETINKGKRSYYLL